MKKHNYIYLGKEKGKRTIYKVGKTTHSCHQRCSHSDYIIGVGIDIKVPTNAVYNELDNAEMFIINRFKQRFKVEHGREYFRCPKYNWEMIKKLFMAEMINYLTTIGLEYEIHEGWTAPHTY